MTVDDDNSIYVGGLPYDATEDSLRRVFDLYGAVVAVKIINDREVGGRCYGFVTFTNPRSAIDAISDMNGRTIGGRLVKVNEVRSRGGVPGHVREHFNRDDRDVPWKGRDRSRLPHRDREKVPDRYSNRSRDWDREHGRNHDRVREHELEHRRDSREKDHGEEHERAYDREWERDREWSRDHEGEKGNEHDTNRGKNRERQLDEQPGSQSNSKQNREFSSSSNEFHNQVKEELELFFQKRDDIQREVDDVDEKLEMKQILVADLHEKSQKLEESLADVKKLFSHRKLQLTKLQRSFLQVKDCNEKLKTYERDLQSLVDSTMLESDDAEMLQAHEIA